MSKTIKIRKGLDINLVGKADKVIVEAPTPKTFAIKPPDFHGVVPKMVVKVGESVKAGSILFKNKYNLEVKFASPVSGTLKEIKRGAKRRILEVIIEADGNNEFETLDTAGVLDRDAVGVKQFILDAGLWPFIKMRPIDIVANPKDAPKSIYISGFDSHPLAPDYDYTLHGKDKEFQAGIDLLKKMTAGTVHLQVKSNADAALKGAKNCQVNTVSGPHPAGNVGVQIHHIEPLNKGEVVWTVNAQDVAIMGATLLTGKYVPTRLVALTGGGAKNQKYYRTLIGAELSIITSGNIEGDNNRFVSGNPLTGDNVGEAGYLGFYHSQVSILPEGDRYKFFVKDGWLSLGFGSFSNSKAYPTWMLPKSKKWNIDTNLNGEERAFVVTEEYEKVFPFDIFPVQLVKAAIINDIDNMEKLGIYEVAPEDFALCEFVCTSKIASQQYIRKALDVINEECM